VLTKFAHVKSRFCGRTGGGKAAFDAPVNPCIRSICSRSVAVGIKTATFLLRLPMPSVQNHPFPASRKPFYFRGVLYLSCILELEEEKSHELYHHAHSSFRECKNVYRLFGGLC